MDPADLFKCPQDREHKKSGKTQKKICITEELAYLPLSYGLNNQLLPHHFSIIHADPYQSAVKLREGEIELGIISAIEYAKKKETWRIVPNIAVSSNGTAKDMLLFFNKGLKAIRTIAIKGNNSVALLLLKILMKEKFMINPEYLMIDAELDQMLSKTDAAFINGDKASIYAGINQNYLDLGEEWEDLTSLPFVYAFWAGREFTINKEELITIKKSYELGKRNLVQIAKEYADKKNINWATYHDFLTHHRNYIFSENEVDGLMEFYNYAFYFGYIQYIPDLYYYEL